KSARENPVEERRMNRNRNQATGDLATRRDFFDSSLLLGLPLLSSLLTSCGSSHDSRDTVAPGAARGKKHKLIWIPQAAGDWELPMRVGHLEFCKMVGWEYQHIGNPIYSVQNHLDELNNAISARP